MNPVIDRLMSELMECNDKRMEAEVEIHNLKSKLAAAERERDTLADKVRELTDCLFHFGVNHETVKTTSFESVAVEGFDFTGMLEHALSLDCGRDYVPRSQLDEAKSERNVFRNALNDAVCLVVEHHAILTDKDEFGFCKTCTGTEGKKLWESIDKALAKAKELT